MNAHPGPPLRHSPDPRWFYASEDDDRSSSQHYSHAGSDITSSSSYSDVRSPVRDPRWSRDPRRSLRDLGSGSGSDVSVSRRIQTTSPLANDQGVMDNRWYEEEQQRRSRRRQSNRQKSNRGENVQSRQRDGYVKPPGIQNEKLGRNRLEYEQNGSQPRQSGIPYNQQKREIDKPQQARSSTVYLRDITRETGRVHEGELQCREVSLDEALYCDTKKNQTTREDPTQAAVPGNPSQQTKEVPSRSNGNHDKQQTATGVNPFDRFSSHRMGGIRTRREKSPPHQNPSDTSQRNAREEETRQRRIRKDFPAEWAEPAKDIAVDEVTAMPTLSSRSNQTTDSGLPPSVRQSPVRTEQTYTGHDTNKTGDQQRVTGRRQEREVVRQRRHSQGSEEPVDLTKMLQRQDLKSNASGSPIGQDDHLDLPIQTIHVETK